MNPDLLLTKKSVHVNIKKDHYLELRSCLIRHNISIQELFRECTKHVIEGTPYGIGLINDIVSRKLKQRLDRAYGREITKPVEDKKIDKHDAETLYKLIDG